MFIQNKIIPSYKPLGRLYEAVISKYVKLDSDKEFIIKGYFESIYSSGNFLNALYYVLVEKDGFCEEGAACYYSEPDSINKVEKFDGVRFEIMGLLDPEYQIDVTEEECFFYFKNACERFLELHKEQEYQDFIKRILNNREIED